MAVDSGAFAKIIQSLQRDSELYFPGRLTKTIALEQTIPRPYSQLARISVSYADGEEEAYIKLYRHPKLGDDHNFSSARREYDAHVALHDAFAGIPRCGVVRPIALFEDLGGWVMESVEGPTLDQVLARQGNRVAHAQAKKTLQETVYQAGIWLRHLQREFQHNLTSTVGEAGVLKEIGQLLDEAAVLSRDERLAVDSLAQQLSQQAGTTLFPIVGQHGECFAPHHVFVDNGTLLVFDITGIKYGLEYEDLSYFWVGLEALLKYPLFARPDVEGLQRSFLEGFADASELNEAAFSLYKLKNMLQLVASWGRRKPTNWGNRVRQQIGLRFFRGWIAKQTRETR